MKVLQVLVLINLFAVFLFSQTPEKIFKVTGTVYDLHKACVVGTEIQVKDVNGKVYKNAKSNERGEYELSLPANIYTIEFVQTGFKKLRVINYEVNQETKKVLNVTLEVGRCEDCNGAIYGERWDEIALITGTIYDSNGAVIENAEVVFRDLEDNKNSVRTNKNGNYKIKIPNGLYYFEVNAAGFKDFKFKDYRVIGTYKGLNFDIVLDRRICDDPIVNCSSVISN